MNKKVVFFDLNGTLVDQRATFRTAFQQSVSDFFGRWHFEPGQPHPEELFEQFEAELKKQTLATSSKRTRLQNEQIQLSALRHTLNPYPFNLSDAFLLRLIERMKQLQTSNAELYPDVVETLQSLSGKYKLALISNSPSTSSIQLQSTPLQPFFPESRIFTSRSEKSAKPNRTIFQRALRQMKVKPTEAIMVGDSWNQDIYGATLAGIDAVWINRKKTLTNTAQFRNDNSSGKPMIGQKKIGRKPIPVIYSCKQLLQLLPV